MQCEKDVGEVEGLYLIRNAFDTSYEKKLYNLYPDEDVGKGRSLAQDNYVDELETQILTSIVMSALPRLDLVPPNQQAFFHYTPQGKFMDHYDSPRRWAEAIIGVNLGAWAIMRFTRGTWCNYGQRWESKEELEGRRAEMPVVNIPLPPRSIYVMSGESRWNWKHGIYNVGHSREGLNPLIRNPGRRSITLRATMEHSLETLQLARTRATATEEPRLTSRIKYLDALRRGQIEEASRIYTHELKRVDRVWRPVSALQVVASTHKRKTSGEDKGESVVSKKAHVGGGQSGSQRVCKSNRDVVDLTID